MKLTATQLRAPYPSPAQVSDGQGRGDGRSATSIGGRLRRNPLRRHTLRRNHRQRSVACLVDADGRAGEGPGLRDLI